MPSAGGLLSLLGPAGGAGLLANLPSVGSATSQGAPAAVVNSVTMAVSDVAEGLLGAVTQPLGAGPGAGVLKLDLGLNGATPLAHVQDLQVSVALLPTAPGQPLLSADVGGNIGVGSAAGSLVDVAPAISLTGGGPALLSIGVTTQGQVAGLPLSVGLGAATVPPAMTVGSPGTELPPAPPAGGPTGGVGPIAVASASAAESSAGAPGAIPRPAPLVNADPGGSRAENPVTAAAAQAARPAAVGADARGASLAAADGGGGGAENNAPASLPAVAPRFPDGGGGDPAALPALTAVPAGGGGARATLDAESAGLATWFQPLGSAGVRHALEDLAAQATAPGGWFAWLLSRLRLAAPWLAALVGVGTVYEIRRRRRRSSREPGQAANAASR